MKIKPLGILIKDNKIALNVVNHRSLRKILLNPIFRVFGFCIGSDFRYNKFEKYVFIKCKKQSNIFRNYYHSLFTCNNYNYIIKEKRI